ncbi:MAG TPA: hypothetical protein VJ833_01900 [Rhodanobacteraceae bacterium]|nr:hypothetical protein [Rhodanobacteraceae bacterium]
MNCKPAPLLLAVTFALTLGIVGCGSSSNNDQPQQPATNTTAQMPPQSPYTAAQPATGATTAQPMGTGPSGMPASNGSAGPTGMSPSFEAVAGSKGYITQQDAQHLPWLQNRFSQCDTNGDGRITRQEYSRCRQGQARGTMQQPPAQPPQGGSSSG